MKIAPETTFAYGRLTFQVTLTGKSTAPYILIGKRGAHYLLMRNVNSNQLFAINDRGKLPFPSQWFSDDNSGDPTRLRALAR